MAVEVVVKKWGNSLGLILPKEYVKMKRLKENEKIFVDIIKETNLSDVFGSLKGKIKMSGQELKDLARKGWN